MKLYDWIVWSHWQVSLRVYWSISLTSLNTLRIMPKMAMTVMIKTVLWIDKGVFNLDLLNILSISSLGYVFMPICQVMKLSDTFSYFWHVTLSEFTIICFFPLVEFQWNKGKGSKEIPWKGLTIRKSTDMRRRQITSKRVQLGLSDWHKVIFYRSKKKQYFRWFPSLISYVAAIEPETTQIWRIIRLELAPL